MNAKIEEIKNQAFNTFGYQGIDDSLNRFAGQLLAEHTKFMQEKLIAWLGHQVYSGNSHRTFDMGFEKSPDWLCWDELREYLGPQIDKLSKEFQK